MQHHVASSFRLDGEPARIQADGLLNNTGQSGGLCQVQLTGVDTEVALSGGLNSVGTVTKIDSVEVALEDFVLGILLFDGNRKAQFADLASDGARACSFSLLCCSRVDNQSVLDVLLRQSRSTLPNRASLTVTFQRS